MISPYGFTLYGDSFVFVKQIKKAKNLSDFFIHKLAHGG